MQIVRVSTPDEAMKGELASLGLDLIESGGPGYIDVLLANPAQGALLNDEGFEFEVLEADLAAGEPPAARRGGSDGRARRRAVWPAERRRRAERRHLPAPLRLLGGASAARRGQPEARQVQDAQEEHLLGPARSSRSRSARTSRRRTGARRSSSRVRITAASGPRPSTRSSSATSSSTATTTATRRSRSS